MNDDNNDFDRIFSQARFIDNDNDLYWHDIPVSKEYVKNPPVYSPAPLGWKISFFVFLVSLFCMCPVAYTTGDLEIWIFAGIWMVAIYQITKRMA